MPMTEEEREVLKHLAAAWNAFVKLPVQHPSHVREMEQAIHQAQRLIMSRPTARDEGYDQDKRERGVISEGDLPQRPATPPPQPTLGPTKGKKKD